MLILLGTPMSPLGLTNLKRNPGENLGVGSILLKSIVISKQAQRVVELSNRTGSSSSSESAGINSTIRSYLYLSIGYRLKIKSGEGMCLNEDRINRRQVLITAEFKGFPIRDFHYLLSRTIRLQTGTNTRRVSLVYCIQMEYMCGEISSKEPSRLGH